jgi:hypothetical protein
MIRFSNGGASMAAGLVDHILALSDQWCNGAGRSKLIGPLCTDFSSIIAC